MDSNLIVSSAKLDENQLQNLVTALAVEINKVKGIKSDLLFDQSLEGTKGEPITFGVIVLSIIKGGSIAALISLLQRYLLREPSLKISIQKKDGTKYIFEQKNMSPEKISEMLKLFEDLSGN